MKAKLIKTEVNYILEDDKGVVIASTSLKKEGLALSIKNCQAIENGYDLDELAENHWDENNRLFNDGINPYAHRFGFKAGFQKALELMGDKRFSEKDMSKAWSEGYHRKVDELNGNGLRYFDKFIQSLQQTEWDVEIEMKKVKDETKIVGAVKGVKGSGNRITTYKSVPKLDVDGCLILKR